MNTTAPSAKIEMIGSSVRCFFLGLFGLLPIVGIPMAIRALRHYRRVRQIGKDHWNPAQRYWFWGGVFARLAIVVLMLEITAAMALLTMALTYN